MPYALEFPKVEAKINQVVLKLYSDWSSNGAK
jgi:hypothetical protein